MSSNYNEGDDQFSGSLRDRIDKMKAANAAARAAAPPRVSDDSKPMTPEMQLTRRKSRALDMISERNPGAWRLWTVIGVVIVVAIMLAAVLRPELLTFSGNTTAR